MRKKNGGGEIKEGRVGPLEAASVLIVFTISKTFLTFPERIAKSGETAAWVVPLASGILSVLWLWPLSTVLKAYPGKDLIWITRRLAGKAVTFVFGIASALFFIGFIASFVSELGDAITGVVLPKTPLILLESLVLAVALFASFHGLEVLGRLSVVGALVVLLNTVILAFTSMNHWDWDSVFPLLGPGLPNLAKTIFVRQAGYGEIIGIAAIAPFIRSPEDIPKSTWWATGIGALTLSLSVLTCQMVFPYPSLSSISVPFLRVARLIYVNRFFQRFDALFVLMWLTAGILSIAFGAWLTALDLASTFSLNTYKPLLVVVMVVIFIAGHLIPDLGTAVIIEYDIVRPYGNIMLYSWPLLVLALHLWKNRKGSRKSGEKSGEAK